MALTTDTETISFNSGRIDHSGSLVSLSGETVGNVCHPVTHYPCLILPVRHLDLLLAADCTLLGEP